MKQHLAFFLLALALVLIAGCADEAATPPQDVSEESAGFVQEEEGYDSDAGALAKFGGPISYRITFQNLSPGTGGGSSQPFSPPVVAVHSRKIRMFRLWHRASDELRQIAEDAVNGPMVSKLVEELFELSKLEARQTRPRPESFSLPGLLDDIIQKFSPLAERHAVSIDVDFPERLPPVHADLGLIERVLQNLLENAVKYNRQGGTVKVRLERSNGRVKISVADSGIGIPEKDLPHVFDRFYRSRRSGTASGAGLGLAITKKILEAHGEAISVESEVNAGTRFSFQLDLDRAVRSVS